MVLKQYMETRMKQPKHTQENCILLAFWSVHMEKFEQASIKLQSTNMHLNEVMKLLQSSYNYDTSLTDVFEDFEEKRKIKMVLT